MPKFKTQYNAKEFPSKKERNNKPDNTLPDQSMSIREIMNRYARGLPIEGSKVPMFDEEDDMPDVRNMDLAEKEEFIRDAKNELQEIEARKKERDAEDARLKKLRDVKKGPELFVDPGQKNDPNFGKIVDIIEEGRANNPI